MIDETQAAYLLFTKMPDLIQSLQGRDLGHLRILSELWGIEFDAPDARIGLQRLSALLTNQGLLEEVVQALPEGARRALQDLQKNEGRLPWALFTRRYGPIREMGAAKRDRERPYLNQLASATEALWYRGLVARSFFDTLTGPEEFAYIPENLLALMPVEIDQYEEKILGRPATPAEKAYILPATDWILDDACTFLAGLRLNLPLGHLQKFLLCARQSPYPLTVDAMYDLLLSAGLLARDGAPQPKRTQEFLEVARGKALVLLITAWLETSIFNELRQIPNLEAEGEWQNDPLSARRSILDFLSSVPGSLSARGDEKDRPFWSLSAFVESVYQSYPDYQRPAGNYDSWYLRDRKTGNYLRGFENWENVDGALLRFVITGPLYWFGIVELGLSAAPNAERTAIVTAFRFSPWAYDLLNLRAPQSLSSEPKPILVSSDGRVRATQKTDRVARYQIARFSEWEGLSREAFIFHLTPASLQAARQQGLRMQHLLTVLHRYAQVVPPGLVNALERWETHGSEARIESVTILRVEDPQIIQALSKSKAARFLGESPDPKMVIIRPEAREKIAEILAELGYLTEIKFHRD